ncbi:alcohol oxidase [Cryphonectria parasitica EP155]|uniref:Alcohol oxidase n=1 Tax=Cryphonectria parasitica (strain ATCC 38755 / EP155) TaxID=660469 RepID=A0A9P4XUU2_CRYP1|nr:alcohol oxidase [Cryphonectria parasitica EP155]KAF3761232.1 alcohol oxidase [Cryphonectria parasitica EP155]
MPSNIVDASTAVGLDGEQFDFVIVGGGLSGLVVASRLTENEKIRVLVLEAGADRRDDPRISCQGLALATYFNPDFDWCMVTEPQAGLNNRPLGQPYGKTLGGSSAINLGMVIYPSKSGFDSWEKLGNPGWGWDGMAPYLRKFHTYTEPEAGVKEQLMLDYQVKEAQGSSGPIQVSYGSGAGFPPFSTAWPRAWSNLNRKLIGDPISGVAVGSFNNPATMSPVTKERSHAGNAYLSEEVANRANLRVITEALATKVLFGTDASGAVKATGVEFKAKNGQLCRVLATHEVILAAGAIKTPQLLELSGIGNKDILAKHGIDCLVDNPNVGENLQDHGFVPFSWEVADPATSADAMRDPAVAKMALEAFTTAKAGPLSTHSLASAFLPLQNEDFSSAAVKDLLPEHFDQKPIPPALKQQFEILREQIIAPDDCSAQYTLAPFQITPSMTDPSPQVTFAMKEDGFYASMVAVLSHPFSRGIVHIRSGDPEQAPVLDPRTMSHPLDLELHARHTLLLEKLRDTSPLRELFKEGGRRLHNGGKRVETLEEAKEAVKNGYTPHYHVCGTAAMMPREAGGVVDSKLRVYGVNGLRIVDASVFPLIPRGNIQTDVYAVAEKAAKLIGESWLES